MEQEHLRLIIEGREADDLYRHLIRLEVELDEDLAGMLRLELSLALRQSGEWPLLEDERLGLWREIRIEAGFESGTAELMAGYITHVRPCFHPDLSRCSLQVWGMDPSALMDREEKQRDWPNMKDSDIAKAVFNEHGLASEVQDSSIGHDEAVSTIIQRETDIRFLKRLAKRNGFVCYFEGSTAHFHPPGLQEADQPALAVHFGPETNVSRLCLEVNGLQPLHVASQQIDRASKEVLEHTIQESDQPAFGARSFASLLPPGFPPGQMALSHAPATGSAEMAALCRSVFQEAEWFVFGEGEVNGNVYGHAMRPGRPVLLKGVGESHSGRYYVTSVTHVFDREGYTQRFKVKRNALTAFGTEGFAGREALRI